MEEKQLNEWFRFAGLVLLGFGVVSYLLGFETVTNSILIAILGAVLYKK